MLEEQAANHGRRAARIGKKLAPQSSEHHYDSVEARVR
jgi:hypothetical protein